MCQFKSNVIKELCELMDIWKVRSSPYHAQTNGQVEQAHQMLMYMIGKLSKDQKVDWPKHLTELVYAYNSMRSAITGYSPQYLMFGCSPHLPIDFILPMIRAWRNTLQEAFKELQEQSTTEAKRQKQYYDRKTNAILLEPGDLVQAKTNVYKRKRKVKDQWEEETYEVVCQVSEDIPFYLMKNMQTKCS